jgi:hypothetical protein
MTPNVWLSTVLRSLKPGVGCSSCLVIRTLAARRLRHQEQHDRGTRDVCEPYPFTNGAGRRQTGPVPIRGLRAIRGQTLRIQNLMNHG